MADTDKNIKITPSTGSSTNFPKIEFTGADNNTVTANVLDNGAVSFEGSDGQLFSVVDSLSGDLYTVNDMSGIPSIHLRDTGELQLAPYYGNLLVGHTIDNGEDKLQVRGQMSVHGDSGQLLKLSDDPNADLLTVSDMSGVAQLRVQNNGAVSKPFNPLFYCNLTYGISTPRIPLSGSDYNTGSDRFTDTQNAFNASTGRYHIPVTGYYYVSIKATLYSNNSGADSRYCAVRIQRNDVQTAAGHAKHVWIAGSTYSERSCNEVIYLEKGDTLRFQIDGAVNGQNTTNDSHVMIQMIA